MGPMYYVTEKESQKRASLKAFLYFKLKGNIFCPSPNRHSRKKKGWGGRLPGSYWLIRSGGEGRDWTHGQDFHQDSYGGDICTAAELFHNRCQSGDA